MLHHAARLTATCYQPRPSHPIRHGTVPLASIFRSAARRAYTSSLRRHSDHQHAQVVSQHHINGCPGHAPSLSRHEQVENYASSSTAPSLSEGDHPCNTSRAKKLTNTQNNAPYTSPSVVDQDKVTESRCQRHPIMSSQESSSTTSFISPSPFESRVSSSSPNPTMSNLSTTTNNNPSGPSSSLQMSHSARYLLPRPQNRDPTRAYNRAIALAIRETRFVHAQRLLDQMHSIGVSGDVHTWKLSVRLLVRTGRWHKAWTDTIAAVHGGTRGLIALPRNPTTSHPSSPFPVESDPLLYGTGPGRGMPLPVWLEFLGTQSPARVRAITDPHTPQRRSREHIRDVAEGIETMNQRMVLLMKYFPALTPEEQARMPPYAIFMAVQWLLRVGRRAEAIKLTTALVARGPSGAAVAHSNEGIAGDHSARFASWQRACLDVLHLHLSLPLSTSPSVSSLRASQTGLSGFYATRKVVKDVLAAHDALRPTPRTLFLLLGSLRYTKQCGTIAWRTVQWFFRRWGDGKLESVEDRRVRRRLASLAIKEGRLDIAEEAMKRQQLASKSETVSREEQTDNGWEEDASAEVSMFADIPLRDLHTRRGKEVYFWKRLRSRMRMAKMAQKQAVASSTRRTAPHVDGHDDSSSLSS